jgi:hypothetical protein
MADSSPPVTLADGMKDHLDPSRAKADPQNQSETPHEAENIFSDQSQSFNSKLTLSGKSNNHGNEMEEINHGQTSTPISEINVQEKFAMASEDVHDALLDDASSTDVKNSKDDGEKGEISNDAIKKTSILAFQTELAPRNLLNMPNELLLKIIAPVPFDSTGQGIINLRLVNHQIRDLLTNEGNLRQLRTEIANGQYDIACMFTLETDEPSWNKLRELSNKTSMVERIVHRLKVASNTVYPDEPAGMPEDVVTYGLHLMDGLHSLEVDVTSELVCSMVTNALTPHTIAAIRLTSLEVTRWFLVRAQEASTMSHIESLLLTPFACAVIENAIIKSGLALLDAAAGTQVDLHVFANKCLPFFVPMVQSPKFIDALIYHETDEEAVRLRCKEKMDRHAGPPASWGMVVNDMPCKIYWDTIKLKDDIRYQLYLTHFLGSQQKVLDQKSEATETPIDLSSKLDEFGCVAELVPAMLDNIRVTGLYRSMNGSERMLKVGFKFVAFLLKSGVVHIGQESTHMIFIEVTTGWRDLTKLILSSN